MKKFNKNVLLDQKIAELALKRDIELLEIKYHYQALLESVKPINIVKQTFSTLYNSPEKKATILELATSFLGGYVSKKIVFGSSNSTLKNILGNVFQYSISALINKFNTQKHEKSI